MKDLICRVFHFNKWTTSKNHTGLVECKKCGRWHKIDM